MKGNNKRLTDTIPGDAYLTPRWAVDWLLRYWQPANPTICDPCACGYGGYTIGRHVADYVLSPRHELELYDINPRESVVQQADCLSLWLPKRSRTIITNPPYGLLSSGEFMRWAWQHADEIVVLTRFGYLCAENGARAKYMQAYLQPAKRLAFEVEPEYADRAGVVSDGSTLTGYRLGSTGVDHGWAVFRRDWAHPPILRIEGV